MPGNEKRTKELDELLAVLCAIDDPDMMYDLLDDLCTPRELVDMAQRLQVAKMLSRGVHYTAIQEKTGASATTIARVSKALNYGVGGYGQALDRLSE